MEKFEKKFRDEKNLKLVEKMFEQWDIENFGLKKMEKREKQLV